MKCSLYHDNLLIIDEERDILLDGDQPSYIKASHFRYWPSNILSQLPMKGISFFGASSKTVSNLNLFRASLVYMLRVNDSNDNGFDLQEWTLIDHKGPYFSWTTEDVKLYSRLLLPGEYKLYDQAIYLFASPGNLDDQIV